jgi:hypothetical protein
MSRTFVVLLGFLGAGLLGGLGARVLGPEGERPPPGPDDHARIEARLADLASRVRKIEDGVGGDHPFSRLPDVRAAEPPAVAGPEASGSPPPPLDPGEAMIPEARIEEKVRATVEEIAREEREARERKAAEAVAEQEAAWVEKVRTELLLTDNQAEGLVHLLSKRREGMAAYKRRLGDLGAVPDEARKAALDQEIADFGRELDSDLRSILSSSQYDSLMNMRRRPAEK